MNELTQTGHFYTRTTLFRNMFEFDGHAFDNGAARNLPFLLMAYNARRGDAVSAELLDAASVVILTADGRRYWPLETREEELRRDGR